jgi:hypothetical protein
LKKNSLKKLDLPKAFRPPIVSAAFRGPKKLNNFTKFRIPKTREKLAKLDPGETSNDLQGLTANSCHKFGVPRVVVIHKFDCLFIIPVPVAPIMTRGCPLKSAKTHPATDVVISVSEIPINPPVFSSVRFPRMTAAD